MDWVVTGASRGIGRALVGRLADRVSPPDRLVVVARSAPALDELATRHPSVVVPRPVDLTRLPDVGRLGAQLADELGDEVTLVHNAGLWPTRRTLVVGAGLMVKGRFDERRTPTGDDFSSIRTYCTTKLGEAVALREWARAHPAVDVAVVHPGVADTDLGARAGLLGAVLRRVKRGWDSPDDLAAVLLDVVTADPWSTTPGEAAWFVERERQPWPAEVDAATSGVRRDLERRGLLPVG